MSLTKMKFPLGLRRHRCDYPKREPTLKTHNLTNKKKTADMIIDEQQLIFAPNIILMY